MCRGQNMSRKKSNFRINISRRTFLKGTAATGAVASMSAAHSTSAEQSTNENMAATLEELADKIGVNNKNFLDTVQNYNECCEKGADWEFFKDKDSLVSINKPHTMPFWAHWGLFTITQGYF
jgi:hypothetical protein